MITHEYGYSANIQIKDNGKYSYTTYDDYKKAVKDTNSTIRERARRGFRRHLYRVNIYYKVFH